MDPNIIAAPAQRVMRYSILVDLAVISLLVDKGILTADELIERIEFLYNRVESAQKEGVLEMVEAILTELRARPGSKA